MRLLHTADWHIGRTLYGKKRYEEFEAFFGWLAATVREREIDVLLIAGDVFDTTAPSHRAQELYYRFLRDVAGSSCRHVVVVAGNHDSPSFLSAPKTLLRALDVHVVAQVSESLDEEILVLRDAQGAPELIVGAVPYLRDRDIRTAEAGESVEDKERKLVEGIRDHYAAVGARAQQKRSELGGNLPVVGMGHLFAAGGQTVDGDGVRSLYVGNLALVTAQIFPACFDYVALGHLHVPQGVGDSPTIRYSGSPLPMGFGESTQQKSVCLVEFHGTIPSVELVPVPAFQRLERIQGNWEVIADRIRELSASGSDVWLEVLYDGEEVIGDLRDRLEAAGANGPLEILRIKNQRLLDRTLESLDEEDASDEWNVDEVFERCLDFHKVPEAQRQELKRTYQEAVLSLADVDRNAD